MKQAIADFLAGHRVHFVHFVDLTHLSPQQTLGYPRAVLFGRALSRDFVRRVYLEMPTEGEEYLEREEAVESLARKLARWLEARGYSSRDQSEATNMALGSLETGYVLPDVQTGPSFLPQKTLARMAGLGFVGRNNLLVTREYGCALVLCSVLTQAPFPTGNQMPLEPVCGSCRRCVDACPSGALTGGSWSPENGRSALLDISKCCCPLRCMIHCPHTLRYAGLDI